MSICNIYWMWFSDGINHLLLGSMIEKVQNTEKRRFADADIF